VIGGIYLKGDYVYILVAVHIRWDAEPASANPPTKHGYPARIIYVWNSAAAMKQGYFDVREVGGRKYIRVMVPIQVDTPEGTDADIRPQIIPIGGHDSDQMLTLKKRGDESGILTPNEDTAIYLWPKSYAQEIQITISIHIHEREV